MSISPILESVLIANRGEIASRVIKTANRMGVRTVAVYSEPDGPLPFVTAADRAVPLSGSAPSETYLNSDRLIEIALAEQVEAVHPGYGFLSESPGFARKVQEAGLKWVGPPAEVMDMMADKIAARNLMQKAGVPVARGSKESVEDLEQALHVAREVVGYPLMVKPSGGGGGIGMSVANDEGELATAFETARSRSTRFFGDSRILLEQYIPDARHVEVQILGLCDGEVVALGERDCSVQRRHQKVAEETPSPGVTPDLRERMLKAAVAAGEAVGYRNAGTVECLVDPVKQEFVFLEMNTRLQVEHPITEAVFGIDLVEAQFEVAANKPVSVPLAALKPSGHALELRIYAEDPVRFLPSPGLIEEWREPRGANVRIDAGYAEGNNVTTFYDPMLAKLIVWAESRQELLLSTRAAISNFRIRGLKTNLPFFEELLDNEAFVSGSYSTSVITDMRRSGS